MHWYLCSPYLTVEMFHHFGAVLMHQVVLEESKEADATTGQATHRISRGIHDKVCALSSFHYFVEKIMKDIILLFAISMFLCLAN